MMPGVMTKREAWKKWKEDVEDFMENMEPGLRMTARTIAKAIEETDKVWFGDMALTGWESLPDVYQVQKK